MSMDQWMKESLTQMRRQEFAIHLLADQLQMGAQGEHEPYWIDWENRKIVFPRVLVPGVGFDLYGSDYYRAEFWEPLEAVNDRWLAWELGWHKPADDAPLPADVALRLEPVMRSLHQAWRVLARMAMTNGGQA